MSFLKRTLILPAIVYAIIYLVTSVFKAPEIVGYLDLTKNQLTFIFACVIIYELGNAVKVYILVNGLSDSEEDQGKWTDEVTGLVGGWSIELAIFEKLRQISSDSF